MEKNKKSYDQYWDKIVQAWPRPALNTRNMKTNNPFWDIAFQAVKFTPNQANDYIDTIGWNIGKMRENAISVRMPLVLTS